MTLDAIFRPYVGKIVDPIVVVLARAEFSPNALSIWAFLFSVIAGLLYYYSQFNILLLWVVVLFIFLNSLFDALDGALARYLGIASLRGDFLDHVLDRYADIFFISGVFFGRYAPWEIGVLALTGVLMTSYLGTQSQAVGVGRFYGGLLGRADRLIILIVATIVNTVYPDSILGLTVLGWALAIFGVSGHLTVIQRFRYTWMRL